VRGVSTTATLIKADIPSPGSRSCSSTACKMETAFASPSTNYGIAYAIGAAASSATRAGH
jgi:hypothetical protein